jgi:ribosomal protein L7/L12
MSHAEAEIFALQQRVDKLERQVAFLLENSGLKYQDHPDQGVSPEILDLVRRGRKVEAIKVYRQQTNAPLKQAKDFIDSLA